MISIAHCVYTMRACTQHSMGRTTIKPGEIGSCGCIRKLLLDSRPQHVLPHRLQQQSAWGTIVELQPPLAVTPHAAANPGKHCGTAAGKANLCDGQ